MNRIVHSVHPIEKDTDLLYIRGERKYLNAAERMQFYRAARTITDPLKRAFCLTLFYTGCRISEALALPVSCVDMAEKVILFKTLKQRGATRYRAVPVPPEMLAALEELMASGGLCGDDLLWPRGRSWGWMCVTACMGKAGLSGIKATPKGLRHAFAVSCVEQSVPLTHIQDLMGHAKIETTGLYLKLVGKEKHTMVSRTWPKGQG